MREPASRRQAILPIKKEIKEFLVASENLYRLFSEGKSLNCHESEVLTCCIEELLAKRRFYHPAERSQKNS